MMTPAFRAAAYALIFGPLAVGGWLAGSSMLRRRDRKTTTVS